MSRPPRILSESGLYHVIFRGINRQNIFEESADYEKFLNLLAEIKRDKYFELYAYCLMTNHGHLFIKENEIGDIKNIMHRLLTRYVMYYNLKYQRSGSLIGNRYKSEPIEDEKYCFALVRYIHQNPLKAGMVQNLEDYEWSSYNDYLDEVHSTTDIDYILKMLSNECETALEEFVEFHKLLEIDDFSISNTKKLTDAQIKRKIYSVTNGIGADKICELPKVERNHILNQLRVAGFSINQIERNTGISRGIIYRATKA